MRLERAVDHVVQHLRAVELDQRDLLPRRRRALGVHLPRRVQRHQPRRVHLRRRVGDPVLDRLLVGQQRAVRVARLRALAQHVERPARDAEPAHAVVDAARAEPLLGDQEAGAARAEQRVLGHAHVLVDDLRVAAVAAEVLVRVLHRRRRRAGSFTPGVSTGTMNIDARW